MNDMRKAFRSGVEWKSYCRPAAASVISSAHLVCLSTSLHYSLFPQREHSLTPVNAFLGVATERHLAALTTVGR
jgi:hypothetical protein